MEIFNFSWVLFFLVNKIFMRWKSPPYNHHFFQASVLANVDTSDNIAYTVPRGVQLIWFNGEKTQRQILRLYAVHGLAHVLIAYLSLRSISSRAGSAPITVLHCKDPLERFLPWYIPSEGPSPQDHRILNNVSLQRLRK